eukprot:jgi/Chlat1/7046/Chrsp56S06717
MCLHVTTHCTPTTPSVPTVVFLLAGQPLTVYHALDVHLARARRDCVVHYLGPERELDQWAVFSDLHYMLPALKLHIHMIGPSVPAQKNGVTVLSVGNSDDNISGCLLITVHHGLYQNAVSQPQLQQTRADLIIACNAGIPAYTSWLPALKVISAQSAPFVVTDYCEEAAVMAQRILEANGLQVSQPVCVNPFRKPFSHRQHDNALPSYSNGFVFGVYTENGHTFMPTASAAAAVGVAAASGSPTAAAADTTLPSSPVPSAESPSPRRLRPIRTRSLGTSAASSSSASASGDGATTATPAVPWRKVLWARQPYGDNHTDESFLASMVFNADVRTHDYWTVVRDSTAVSQQISTVVLLAVMCTYTLMESVLAKSLLALDAAFLTIGFILRLTLTKRPLPSHALQRNALQCTLFVCGVYVLSPILQTLTSTISSDTIWATTICLLLLHLFLYDYSYANTVTARLTGNVSLNAAIVASVLMASRLPSHRHVFALILFSLELFILFPILCHHIKCVSPTLHLVISSVMAIGTAVLLLPLSQLLTTLYAVVIAFVTFVCPFWLIRIQKYKHQINGPWDEAKPQIHADDDDLKLLRTSHD